MMVTLWKLRTWARGYGRWQTHWSGNPVKAVNESLVRAIAQQSVGADDVAATIAV